MLLHMSEWIRFFTVHVNPPSINFILFNRYERLSHNMSFLFKQCGRIDRRHQH